VPPTDQRLHPGRRPRLEVDLGLQRQRQLVVGRQRIAQLGQQREVIGAGGLPAAVVGGDGDAQLLGLSEGDPALAQQLRQVAVAGPADDDADRHLQHQPHTGDLHRPGDVFDHLAGAPQRLRPRARHLVQRRRRVGERRHVRQQQRELVVTEPRHPIVLAGQVGEAFRDGPQHLVAGLTAQRAVDLAEVLEVDQQQRDVPVPVERAQQRVAVGQQRGPVGEPGQRVVHPVVRHPGVEGGQAFVRGRVMQGAGERVPVRGDGQLVASHGQGRLGEPHRQLAERGARHRHRVSDHRPGQPVGVDVEAGAVRRIPALAALREQDLDLDAGGAEDVEGAPYPRIRDLGLGPARQHRDGLGERLPDPALLVGAQVVAVRALQKPECGREREQPERLAHEREDRAESDDHVADEHRHLGVQGAQQYLPGRRVAVQHEGERGQAECDDEVCERAGDEADLQTAGAQAGVPGDGCGDRGGAGRAEAQRHGEVQDLAPAPVVVEPRDERPGSGCPGDGGGGQPAGRREREADHERGLAPGHADRAAA
jgi:hypothetical protein